MDVDLAGDLDGISERFVPDRDPGRLIEVEHLSRYMWAAEFAAGRSVLDAGCGSGYGCRRLAEAGAREVTGVDIAADVLEAIAPAMPDAVSLRTGDLHALPFEDESFELVVCFEVIEHIADPLSVLDELVRVLAPNGLLLVSSPNRGVYQEGNPHHLHEFEADELRAAMQARLPHVALMRQSDYIVSAVLGDEAFAARGGTVLSEVPLRKLIGGNPGEEVYTIALAAREPLPDAAQIALMTGTLEMREWLAVFATQTDAIDDKDVHIESLKERLREASELAPLLMDTEQQLASIPDLELRIADLEHALHAAEASARAGGEQLAALDRRLMDSEQVLVDVLSSPSWQITKPLRAVKRILRR